MALRAFLSNPSIGGFGGESSLSLPQPQTRIGRQHDKIGRADFATSSNTARTLFNDDTIENVVEEPDNSCDAFAAIVKELVDNAVDACACAPADKAAMKNDNDMNAERSMKRVRVIITAVKDPVISNGKGGPKKMRCLRIEVCDNGCGMEDIDYCVSVFSSNKNAAMKKNIDFQESQITGTKRKSKGKIKPMPDQTRLPSPINEKYTSGRYGVGLTLCLLHAQRLVPGTGACITSAVASAEEWIRATYEPDTDADNIVCKKKESFPKLVGESGTTISLFVPGGESAHRAWPRLAEYFARFQLSIDLPCSLEVKAPTLQFSPLYIRPAAEIERRIRKNSNSSHPVDASSVDCSEEKSIEDKWEGDDGFGEGLSRLSLDDRSNRQAPKMKRTNGKRIEAEMQRIEKISLIHRAASAYKRRPDLKLENVSHSIQPIRRNLGRCQSTSSENGSVLEVSMIVFGQDLEDNEDRYDIEADSSKLYVVRMVNGIPLLDSSEALACGVMRKVSNSAATWNSFGLEISQNNGHNLEFEVRDSKQVAPFLEHSTHSMFDDHCRDYNQSSSESEDAGEFDAKTSRGKRKSVRQRKRILPAALRLGHVLMIVQIRAKPSTLPLPTLSKGRLPLNDKGISDALLNGISECLRTLQRSSPGLLLTVHQLKKVERDVKYIPLVSTAIASILCSPSRLCDRAQRITSTWDNVVEAWRESNGNRLENEERTRQEHPLPVNALDNMQKKDAFRQAIERRLQIITSKEFKSSKLADDKELRRRNREDSATTKKRAKTNIAVDTERMENDCFESDGNCSSKGCNEAALDHYFYSSSVKNNICCQSQGESSTSSSLQPSVDSSTKGRGYNCSSKSGNVLSEEILIGVNLDDNSSKSMTLDAADNFDDRYESFL